MTPTAIADFVLKYAREHRASAKASARQRADVAERDAVRRINESKAKSLRERPNRGRTLVLGGPDPRGPRLSCTEEEAARALEFLDREFPNVVAETS